MKKILLFGGVVVISLLIGAGATFGVMTFLHSTPKSPAGPAAAPHVQAAKPKPKPIIFAELADVTVSLPPESGAPATSYVTLSMKFQTDNPAVLVSYAEVEPIIKADIITRLMNETTASLQGQANRNDFIRGALTIANTVIHEDGNLPSQDNAFSAAYITNLVTQN